MTSIKPTWGLKALNIFHWPVYSLRERERLSGQEGDLECLLWRGRPALEPEETYLVLLQSASAPDTHLRRFRTVSLT